MMPTLEVSGMAHGGDGVAHRGGKAVFVRGGFPGDVVSVEVIEERKHFERAVAVAVVEASPHRVEPRCMHVDSCGGCVWQRADPAAQRSWKREVVESQLAHIGRLETDVAETLAVGPDYGYRNRMDFRVLDGRPAMFRRASRDLVPLAECHLLVEPLAATFAMLPDLGGVRRITLRAGVATGEQLAIVDGPAPPLPIPAAGPGHAVIHEVVAGHPFRISGRSFFQVNTSGAEHLVALVAARLAGAEPRRLLDLYAGGGLFAATVAGGDTDVTAVEHDRRAASDLAHNAPGVTVVHAPVWAALAGLQGRFEVVVADPPREGMGRRVVDGIAALDPERVVLVSCDPAAFARDARLLVDRGFAAGPVQPVDLFPHTHHIETIGTFLR
jgi:tRNA/tmRNA/rRNA uracil-C5-methylase (TrmA/RlmC/RlmD family)